METSTTPKMESSYQGEDWLLDLENLSPSDAAFLAQREARHKRVGELFRELHYLDTSNPPVGLKEGANEDDYWLGEAKMSPGLSVERLEKELLRRKSASSTAAARQVAAAL